MTRAAIESKSHCTVTTNLPSPMNFLPRSSAARRPHSAGTAGSHVVPVRDVQWGRPVFRPPALPSYPLLADTVPFTAMRPLRPTRRDAPDSQG